MYSESNGRVRVLPTKSVYSNIGSKASRRKAPKSAPASRAKTPRRIAVRAKRETKVPVSLMLSRPKPRVIHEESKMSLASGARLEAAKAVMGQFFPGTYRGVVAAGETTNAPVTAITITDRYSVLPVGGLCMVDVSPTIVEHVRLSSTMSSTTVTGENIYSSSASTALLANSSLYRCSGMEVVIEPNVASADIQGEWAIYCFQGVNTIVGRSVNEVLTNPQASRGFFTDAKPSCRFVWFKKDEQDDDWWASGYLPGNGETSVRFALNATTSPIFIVYTTTTWTLQPNAAGQFVIPGKPTIIDQAAYQRGLKVFGDAVNENVEIVTNPRVAQQKHPGILAQVADAVSETVGEAGLLKKALGGAWNLGKSLVGAVTSLFSMPKENAAIVTAMVLPCWVKQLEAEQKENKESTVPDDVIAALKTLARYRVNRGRRGELMEFECVEGSESINTIVLPLSRCSTKATR